MTDVIPDLWPEAFGQLRETPPITILRQQGIKLGEKTRNLVYGEVKTKLIGEDFEHSFDLCAPELAYRQTLVLVKHHKVTPYPVMVRPPAAISGPEKFRVPTAVPAATPSELMDVLKEQYFQSESTINLVGSLLAQSEVTDPD